jgi:hypothetical protein
MLPTAGVDARALAGQRHVERPPVPFCGSTRGPFNKVEGLFTVLMCADCQGARGHGPVVWCGSWRAPNGHRYRIEAWDGHQPIAVEGSSKAL